MRQRVVFICLGLVLMAAGSAGMVYFHVNQQKEAARRAAEILQQREEAQKVAAAEQQRQQDELLRQEETARREELQRQRKAEEDRRLRAEEERRRKPLQTAQRQEKVAKPHVVPQKSKPNSMARAVPPPPKRQMEARDRHTAPTMAPPPPPRGFQGEQREYWRGSVEGRPSRVLPGGYNLDEIAERAAREAAATLRRVEYVNPATHERVRADPMGRDWLTIRVRIRTWESGALVCDGFQRFDHLSQLY